jgi:uncharacterized protein YjiS (DUF1127 family)
MWNIKRIRSALSALRSAPVCAARGLRQMIVVLDLALEVRRERRILLSMDDRALKDIGISRSEACAEARCALWDIPRDRLLL